MKIKEALYIGISNLKEKNIDEAHSKARRLLAFSLNVPKEYLIINNENLSNSFEINETDNNYIITIINKDEKKNYIFDKTTGNLISGENGEE